MLGTRSSSEIEDLLGDHIDNLANWRSVIAWDRFARSANGHASIYRIHLFEKTGRFERR